MIREETLMADIDEILMSAEKSVCRVLEISPSYGFYHILVME